jgi:hypothetical protein
MTSEETMHRFFSFLAVAALASTASALAGQHDHQSVHAEQRSTPPAQVHHAHEQRVSQPAPQRVAPAYRQRAAILPPAYHHSAGRSVFYGRAAAPASPRRAYYVPVAKRAEPFIAHRVPFVQAMRPVQRHDRVLPATIVREAPFVQYVPSNTREQHRSSFVQTVYVNRPADNEIVYQRWIRRAQHYDSYGPPYGNAWGWNRHDRERRGDDGEPDDNNAYYGYNGYNSYFNNAVYNDAYYNDWNAGNWYAPYYTRTPYYNNGYYDNGYYGNGFYDPNAYYGSYPYGNAPYLDGGLGTVGTIITLAQLAGVNLGDLGVLGDLAGTGGGYYGSGYAPPYYAQPYYSGYGNPYSPSQLTGLVVSNNGYEMIVMTPNFTPVVVDDAPAYQLGYVSSNVRSGALIDALGYYSGSTFIATAIQ